MTGEPLQAKSLIKLNYSRNSEGKLLWKGKVYRIKICLGLTGVILPSCSGTSFHCRKISVSCCFQAFQRKFPHCRQQEDWKCIFLRGKSEFVDRTIDWLIERSNDWSIDWLIERVIDWLIDWSNDRSIDWLIERSIDWLIDWESIFLIVYGFLSSCHECWDSWKCKM